MVEQKAGSRAEWKADQRAGSRAAKTAEKLAAGRVVWMVDSLVETKAGQTEYWWAGWWDYPRADPRADWTDLQWAALKAEQWAEWKAAHWVLQKVGCWVVEWVDW